MLMGVSSLYETTRWVAVSAALVGAAVGWGAVGGVRAGCAGALVAGAAGADAAGLQAQAAAAASSQTKTMERVGFMVPPPGHQRTPATRSDQDWSTSRSQPVRKPQ